MLFNSLEYLLFLPLVFIVYYLLPFRFRWVILLISSYYFYMSWNVSYSLLMLFVTITSYLSGLLIDVFRDSKEYKNMTKGTMLLGLTIIISLLLYFKYATFLSESFFGIKAFLGGSADFNTLDIILPVGISFFTFQAMGYVVDVYHEKQKPERHLGIYALYVSFFPQLVAGPIERSSNLLPQFHKCKSFNYDQAKNGLVQILWGFFLKLVIADRVALLVNQVYNSPREYEGWALIIATVFFAFQIFCDFAGYSHIAIGSAKLFGIDLMKNFDRPYLARSIGEFWRRWHISLSTWFKDYLFVPLGGSRMGRWLTYRNILIVFVVSGLWHGASWTFVVWGFIHGLYWIADHLIRPYMQRGMNKLNIESKSLGFISGLVTFSLVCVAWIFFRANSLSDAWYILTNMTYTNPQQLFTAQLYKLGLEQREFYIALISILFLITIQCMQSVVNIREWINRQWVPLRWGIYMLVVLVIVLYGYSSPAGTKAEFIYFQF